MIYNNHIFILSFVQTSHQFSCLIECFRYFERCVCCQDYVDIIQLISDVKTYLFRRNIVILIVVNITLISQFIYIFCIADRQKNVPKNTVSRWCLTCLSVWEFSREYVFGRRSSLCEIRGSHSGDYEECLLSSGMSCCVVWKKFADVSEECTVSILARHTVLPQMEAAYSFKRSVKVGQILPDYRS
jgi:hypothetical protein